MSNKGLSHVNAEGEARMVNVAGKEVTERRATAQAVVRMSETADRLFREGNLPKGSPREVVRLAGIQAAKQTHLLLPLCHPVHLTAVEVDLEDAGGGAWRILATVSAEDRTGVEMEALTAASIAALALYDMVKAVDRGATLGEVFLLEKSGGKSGHYQRSKGD